MTESARARTRSRVLAGLLTALAASPCTAQSGTDTWLRPSRDDAPVPPSFGDARVQLGGLCGGASGAAPGVRLESRGSVVGEATSASSDGATTAAGAAQVSFPATWHFRIPGTATGELAAGPTVFYSALDPHSLQPDVTACGALESRLGGALSVGIVAQSHELDRQPAPLGGVSGRWRRGLSVIPHARLRF